MYKIRASGCEPNVFDEPVQFMYQSGWSDYHCKSKAEFLYRTMADSIEKPCGDGQP
jgi:hypothetical protein